MKQLLYLTLACWLPLSALSQVAINTNGAAPDTDAMLDIASTDKGLLVPRMNQAQMEAVGGGSPTTGMMVFNTASNAFFFYDGSSWVPLDPMTDMASGTVYLGLGAIAVDAEKNVGIGTDQPASLLHLSSDTQSTNTGLIITQGSANSLFYHNENGDMIMRKQNQSNQLVLDSGGNIGIGTDAPAEKLHVNGNLRVNGDLRVDGNIDGALESDWYGADMQNFFVGGGSSGWGNVGNIATLSGLQNGDVILVMVSFLFKLDGGSGTDNTAFRINAEGPSESDYSTDTGVITDLNRNDTQLFSFQRVITLSKGAGQYNFRLQIDRSLTDDDVSISRLQIVAMKLQ